MLGWCVGVTDERRADEQLELLHRRGARTAHGPMRAAPSLGPDDRPGARPAADADALVALLPDADGPSRRLVTLVAERAVDAVTFTSSVAVANFVALARAVDRLDEVRASLGGTVLGGTVLGGTVLGGPVLVVSIGPSCTEAILDAGFAPPLEPPAPRLEAMVISLGDHAAERRLVVSAGHVELLLDATHPVVDGTVVEMGPRERGVLDLLAHRPGAVVSKVALCRQVWGRSTGLHAVEVTVGRLRDRLSSACGGMLSIDTVPRRGYRLVGVGQEGRTLRSAAPATRPE